MMYLINVITLIILSIPLTIFLKRKFEEVIPLTIMGTILIMYILSIFGFLKIGTYIIYFLAIISIIFLIIYSIKNGQKDILVKNIFTTGFLVFILGATVIFLITNGRMLQSWDEFTHWGLSVKNMCYLDAIGGAKVSTTIAIGYPPGISLFEYFFANFTIPFSEAELFRSINIMSLSLIMPIFKIFSWKNKAKIFFSLPVIFITPFIFYPDFLSTIYVDAILGVIFFFILLIYFLEEEFSNYKTLVVTLGISVLLITKSTGIGFALGALFIFAVDILFFNRKQFLSYIQKSKTTKGTILFSVIFLVFIKTSWSVYLKYISGSTVWSGVNSFRTGEVQITIIKNFLKQFLFDSNGTNSLNSNFMWIVRMFVIVLCILYFAKTKKEVKRILTYSSILIFGYIGYSFSILYMYLFLFSEYEAITLNSYDRYINSFGIAAVMFLLFILMKNVIESETKLVTVKLIIISCLVISLAPLHTIAKETLFFSSEIRNIKEKRAEYSNSEGFNNILDKAHDKIYFICQNSTGYEFWVNRYNSSPVLMIDGVPWSLGRPYYEGDIWTKNLSVEEWEYLLLEKKCTFVYLYRIDPQFADKYSGLFDEGAIIKNDTLYKIEIIDGETKLIQYEDGEKNLEK